MKNDLPKGVTELPSGIQIHGNNIRIDFMYHGKRCREAITGYTKITKQVIQYAVNKRNVIVMEIKEGSFDYLKHFPESKQAAKYAGVNVKRLTVNDAVDSWLDVKKNNKAKSTFRGYKSKSLHIKEKWGCELVKNITKSEIEYFQSELLGNGLSPKTVNDCFTILRGVWSDAFHDGIIQSNPCDRVKNVEMDNLHEHADPFDVDELKRIENLQTTRKADIAMIMFWCWSGLSISEITALAWEDVDLERWTVKVQRARVLNQFKVPKEKGRVRVIELLEPAKHWLQKQMEFTMMLPQQEFTIKQRDNITERKESIRLVFMNSVSGCQWYDHSLRRWFSSVLKRAKLRHRGPNQCRHTFASQLLSNYVPLEWIARQMGHSDTTMIKKHYGKWIPKDSIRMADQISKMICKTADKEGLKTSNFVPNSSQTKRGIS